jgi:hypothetical protein
MSIESAKQLVASFENLTARVSELLDAQRVLSDNNEYLEHVHTFIAIRQGTRDWETDVPQEYLQRVANLVGVVLPAPMVEDKIRQMWHAGLSPDHAARAIRQFFAVATDNT